MTTVETAPHELEGYLHYAANGDTPYWALSSLMQVFGGGFEGETRDHPSGDTWTISTGFRKAEEGPGLTPRPSDPINVEKLAEWKIMLRGPRETKATYFVRPRWKQQKLSNGKTLTSWVDSDENPDLGIDVEVKGSNLEPDRYPKLLRWALDELGKLAGQSFNSSYLAPRNVYLTSKVTAYERYVRLHEDEGLKLVNTGGLLTRLHLLLGDQTGTKYTLKVDNAKVLGHRHLLQLRPSAAKELPTGARGKQLKHYHMDNRDADGVDENLRHPKFGVLLKKRFHGSAFDWREMDDLTREIDETLINCLQWAGIPTHADGLDSSPWIPDDHFTGGQRPDDAPAIARYSDPTPQIEAEQQNILVRTLRDLTDSDDAVLRAMTDGGVPEESHPREIADESGLSIRTVYRALSRLDELVENDNAAVRFRSEKIRQELHGVYERLEDTVNSTASAICRVLDLDPEVVRQNGSAFERWLARYAADVNRQSHDQMTIKIGATLSRYKGTSNPFVGEVLDYLDKVLSRSGVNLDRDQLVIHWSDGSNSNEMTWLSRDCRKLRRRGSSPTG
ncbi:hypothetical protein [Haloarchaeobius sp. DYHT-AS-18]|uniref:DUF7845 domain-containing protein n=1 Tax=Haloarchaeobius sp. DYHT-AS-18 TaxID=3446117 RepID=UPI003EB92F3D